MQHDAMTSQMKKKQQDQINELVEQVSHVIAKELIFPLKQVSNLIENVY